MPDSPEHAPSPAGTSHPKKRTGRRKLLVFIALLLTFMLAVGWIRTSPTDLNADERRLVGTWTWMDDPGETVFNYRSDSTMCYAYEPFVGGPVFCRWWIDGHELHVEYSDRSPLRRFVTRQLFRNAYAKYIYPVRFRDDGVVIVTQPSGTTRGLKPWQGRPAERLQQAE